jgi:two-component system, NarL family, response regulator DesR
MYSTQRDVLHREPMLQQWIALYGIRRRTGWRVDGDEFTDGRPGCSPCRVGVCGFVHRAIQSGVAGFVLKDAPIEKLADAIRRCAAGQNVVDPELAARALRAGTSPLSSREQEILGACAEGLATAEVARRLWLSEGTVRNRVSEILSKLGARTRSEAVLLARENGWL